MRLAACSLGALTVVLAYSGCQRSPTTTPAAKTDGALAVEALERGDYANAAALYQRALTAAPDSAALHYGLGVSASHLGQRDVAIRELTWVLAHGDAGSDAVRAARSWLVAAGALRAAAIPRRAHGRPNRRRARCPRDDRAASGAGPCSATARGRWCP
jgi:hypothetical protein